MEQANFSGTLGFKSVVTEEDKMAAVSALRGFD